MERKRKLPARAAARVERDVKKRNITPRGRSEASATPQPADEPTPPRDSSKDQSPAPPAPLPQSIQVGKPLPTVESLQPDDLPSKDYQSMFESGVLSESLSRSRHKWLNDGLFEKYWSKPHKRKGVIVEEPNNPPKDSMTKVGTVTICLEPHVVEATMFAVKAPKPKQDPALASVNAGQAPTQTKPPIQGQPLPQAVGNGQTQLRPQPPPPNRPIIQYGPPNGSMPPPPTPASGSGTPTVAPATPVPKPEAPSHAPNQVPAASASPATQPQAAAPTPPQQPIPGRAAASPSLAVQPSPTPSSSQAPPAATPPPAARAPSNPPSGPPSASAPASRLPPPVPRPNAAPKPPTPTPAAGSSAAPAPKPAANDPVIALLAQKASGDSQLRDLMKRVAMGQAREGELAHFQKIIDQLNAEYKRKGGQQGPSADRLVVDGKTVKYFADEVRTILDIVLASNPNQRSTELRPPPGSDPLVVLLVKTALEDSRTKNIIKRIAEGQPGSTDATDLKEILDRLHRDAKLIPRASPAPSQGKPPAAAFVNGQVNGHVKGPGAQVVSPNPQALRSKGPPPAPKPDISAVVFDFGTGDRYLFPKFSILEFLPTSSGQQVVASFLIVRKGSISEYGGDPSLDYYQPVTIRLVTQSGRFLENLARVVAPQDEVQRYMDDVMDNMTRAEYVLLAMRLPRVSHEVEKDDVPEEPKTSASTPKPEIEQREFTPAVLPPSKPTVLWTSTAANTPRTAEMPTKIKTQDLEEENHQQYQRLITAVTARDVESV